MDVVHTGGSKISACYASNVNWTLPTLPWLVAVKHHSFLRRVKEVITCTLVKPNTAPPIRGSLSCHY